MSQDDSTIPVRFTINGRPVEFRVRAAESALETLRERLGLKGPKQGCGIGECGACTIVVDGKAVNACLMPAGQLDGRTVLTVEGLAPGEELHPLQQAFLDHHAVQCGFCTPGILMGAQALLAENPKPSRREIIEALAGHLCRCTGYQQIIEAVAEGARRLSRENDP